eukprot:60834_1
MTHIEYKSTEFTEVIEQKQNNTPESNTTTSKPDIHIDNKEEKEDKWDNCESVHLCKPLQHLLCALKWWMNNSSSTQDILIKYFDKNKIQIINDYHHILNHLNEDIMNSNITNQNFKQIQQEITMKNLVCDIQKCEIYVRSNRNREAIVEHKDPNIMMLVDIFDCIHNYFIHSIDCGYRINHQNNMSLTELKLYLEPKIKLLKTVRGSNRIVNTKFVTLPATEESKESKQDELILDDIKPAFYCFGKRSLHDFFFPIDPQSKMSGLQYPKCPKNHPLKSMRIPPSGWGIYVGECDGCHEKIRHSDFFNGCTQCDYCLCSKCYVRRGKYSSLKEEIITNNIYKLDICIFNAAYEKAVILEKTNEIKSMTIKLDKYNRCYGVNNKRLSLKHILSVVLYTDYDTLSYNFSLTFRNNKYRDREFLIW